jgi:hypothetical protein
MKGASWSRRSNELVRAAGLLRDSHPDLATRLREQARFLSDREPLRVGRETDVAQLYGELRVRSRDELVEAGKALLEASPSMAHLLLSQAAALVTSHKLRGQISALAANARRRAEEVRSVSRQQMASAATAPPEEAE